MRRKKQLSLRSNQARKKQQKPNAIGRGGALLRPMGSYKSVQHSVGADDSVGPKNVANSPKISVKTVRSAGGQSRPPLRWNTQVRSNLPRFSAEQLPSAGRSRAPPLPTASRFTIVTQNKRTMHHRRRGFIKNPGAANGRAVLLRAPRDAARFQWHRELRRVWSIFLLPFHDEHAIREERKNFAAAVQ